MSRETAKKIKTAPKGAKKGGKKKHGAAVPIENYTLKPLSIQAFMSNYRAKNKNG